MTSEVGRFRRYEDLNLKGEKLQLIGMVAPILEEYERAGYAMTLRQLYYQLVARGKIENVKENYDKLGDAVSDGRMAGLLSWTAIEDRVRFLRGVTTYGSPEEVLTTARDSYRTDLWKDQMIRPEVWVEKDALIGVLEPICNELRVDYFSCKGYGSQSELWRAGQRFAGYIQKGQRPVVLYLGDHDPSGIHMTKDVERRLRLFAGVPIQVVRIALNMSQVEEYDPPPNPVKPKDARTADYVRQFGIETCWELDALPPGAVQDLIRGAVTRFRDPTVHDMALKKEAEDRDDLDRIVEELKDE